MQQWTLESGILFFLSMLISSCRYASYWSLMNFMMGCQLNGISGEEDEEREQRRIQYNREDRSGKCGQGKSRRIDQSWSATRGKVRLKSDYSNTRRNAGF